MSRVPLSYSIVLSKGALDDLQMVHVDSGALGLQFFIHLVRDAFRDM